MFYLIKDVNGKNQIIDNTIFSKGKVWSCSRLLRDVQAINDKLYYEAIDGSLSFAGNILKKSDKKIDFIIEGLKIKYEGEWYIIRTLEGKEGLFITVPKPIGDANDRAFVQIFVRVEKLIESKIEDISC